ncbi:hypothetical protein LCGC14_2986290, partial [marine sediment metagenome]
MRNARPMPSLTPRDIELFWAKVNKSPGQGPAGECWEWQGSRGRHYGSVHLYGVTLPAHRVAYYITHGKLLPNLCVCHTCDNGFCCSPKHLWCGTLADNNADKHRKGRANSCRGEQQGPAKLTEANVIEIRNAYASGDYTQARLAYLFSVG